MRKGWEHIVENLNGQSTFDASVDDGGIASLDARATADASASCPEGYDDTNRDGTFCTDINKCDVDPGI